MQTALIAILGSALILSALQIFKLFKRLKRYSLISDAEVEARRILANARKIAEENSQSIAKQRNKFDIERKTLQTTLDNLADEVKRLEQYAQSAKRYLDLYNEESELQSAGFYKSKYDFENSERYEVKLNMIREEQKAYIKSKAAIVCDTTWTVEGSAAKGKTMTDRTIKLGLSAFNVQCDNEILKVKFGNIHRAEERLEKILENVNRLLDPNKCRVTREFYALKREELFLVYEYQEKLHEEKEEQKAIKEAMREEDIAKRELDRIKKEAEKEEDKYQRALEKAKFELSKKSEFERAKFEDKIQELEYKLAEAIAMKQRAISQAQLTRSGYVYIISNVGSFGENVYKIGMTRRFDPQDRVDELGTAAVPFRFDIHATIKSDDAPTLERKLHEIFHYRRINRINERKEFFRVSLEEIESACRRLHDGDFKFTKIAEAKEYRQSLTLVDKDSKRTA